MRQIKEGLFEMEGVIPYHPKEIRISPYILPDTLGRTEREEAAARIITFSQQVGQWVGVSWEELFKMMLRDFELDREKEAVRDHNKEEMWRVFQAKDRRFWRSIFTLGLYALFVAKPTADIQEEPAGRVPISTIFMMGPHGVANGIQELVEQGLLRIVTEGEGDSEIDVVFPTPALLERIMQKQGVSSAPA